MTTESASLRLHWDDIATSKLVRGLEEGKALVRNPNGWTKSLHQEIRLSKYASFYLETLQGVPETCDDFELLLFLDWKILPDRNEAPMDIYDTANGIPETVDIIKEIVERETGYQQKYISFELTNNLVTQAVYRAFAVDTQGEQ